MQHEMSRRGARQQGHDVVEWMVRWSSLCASCLASSACRVVSLPRVVSTHDEPSVASTAPTPESWAEPEA